MTLQVPQGKGARSIVESTARLNLWEGSVRSSKTTNSLIAWLDFIESEAPPGDLYMIGRTERTLERNCLNPLKLWLGRSLKHNRGLGSLRIFGRDVYIAGASDERAAERIQGATAAGIYGDEVTTWPASMWKMQVSRMSVEGARGFYTMNPDSPHHHIKTDVIDRKAEPGMDCRVFHFTLDDNPFLPQAYKAALKAEYGGPGTLWYRRYIDGLWVLAEGAIYDMWSDIHVVHGLPPPSDVAQAWIAIDYGTAAPFVALLLLHVTAPFEHILVAREWRWDSEKQRKSLTDPQYSQALTDWLNSELPYFTSYRPDKAAPHPSSALRATIIDPSASSFITQVFNDGYQRVWHAQNAILDGIRSVSTLLAQRRLLVHESCEGLLAEMPGYPWDPKAQLKGEDKPLPTAADHSVDALRYGCHTMRQLWKPWIREKTPKLREGT